jgi:hypothetical protein
LVLPEGNDKKVILGTLPYGLHGRQVPFCTSYRSI